MKQAYTNTIRGGSRNPLTIATGAGKKGGRGKAKQVVPKCAYGLACTRKGCAYRHPESGAYESYHEDPRSKICKPFLAGLCTYGSRCMNRHPDDKEADAVKATYKQKSCSYGDECQTEGCLYFHPYEALERSVEEHVDPTAGELCGAVGGLHLDSQQPTYEEWLAMNCPAPPSVDETQLHSMWYYPGSEMQRDPWDVYCLMYPKQSNARDLHATTSMTNLSAVTQSWEPSANLVATSQSWRPLASAATNDFPQQQQQNNDPKTFEEWKKTGCPYPSWFCSDHDPWYDDEGLRRSLKEVYEVLYGENAQTRFEEHEAQQTALDFPTPAEVVAAPQSKEPTVTTTTSPASGGWASIAAKRPDPAVLQQNSTTNNSQSVVATTRPATNKKTPHKTVVIPKEVWLPDTANADCFHLYPDPIQRFIAVNDHHKTYLASVSIPKCFDATSSNFSSINSNRGGKNGENVTLLDVHFQSAKTVYPVLYRFLPQALKDNDEVWIITGSGSHIEAGHQRRGDKSGGVLFNAVKNFLLENEENMGMEYRVGKDTSGGKNAHSAGAFLVRKTT